MGKEPSFNWKERLITLEQWTKKLSEEVDELRKALKTPTPQPKEFSTLWVGPYEFDRHVVPMDRVVLSTITDLLTDLKRLLVLELRWDDGPSSVLIRWLRCMAESSGHFSFIEIGPKYRARLVLSYLPAVNILDLAKLDLPVRVHNSSDDGQRLNPVYQ